VLVKFAWPSHLEKLEAEPRKEPSCEKSKA
jgi:hypothetical protein